VRSSGVLRRFSCLSRRTCQQHVAVRVGEQVAPDGALSRLLANSPLPSSHSCYWFSLWTMCFFTRAAVNAITVHVLFNCMAYAYCGCSPCANTTAITSNIFVAFAFNNGTAQNSCRAQPMWNNVAVQHMTYCSLVFILHAPDDNVNELRLRCLSVAVSATMVCAAVLLTRQTY